MLRMYLIVDHSSGIFFLFGELHIIMYVKLFLVNVETINQKFSSVKSNYL